MKTEKGKKILLFSIITVAVLVLGAGGYIWQAITSTVVSIQEDIDRAKSEKRLEEINFEDGDPISVLLMGIDDPQSRQDPGRADTLILLTINPHQESINMVSIPRDTYTDIIGGGSKGKISHAHAIGGSTMMIRTVEDFLDVPVDYFVKVNMDSFSGIVDAIGGIEVDNEFDFTFHDKDYPQGTITLDGEEALGYARMRHEDPRGDFGRQERQRQVIEAVIEKGSSISSATKFTDIFEVVEDNVKTNVTLDDLWNIHSSYREAINHKEQLQIEGENQKIDGYYHYIPDEKQLNMLSEKLKTHLELSE
ncbi:transcriptional attenuator, LytR family [Alteribacillus persepolensis]|uniref:Transcriptional attenuator, LytR family n=1 Tax=Alteribacillus persepolensis TaxID=568899 RepID=A0A1G8ISL6_9BACI|nr:LCP family protein [Alteribacillus persepolensis]SDI21944.1 transcriptional attenuator, LytR family [Alteribacillus persepolensis]